MPFKLHRYLQGLVRTNYPVQWARTAVGRKLDWIRGGNFLVVSAVRSGTTVMVDYLNSSREIRCFGEILGPGHIRYGYPYRLSRERLRLHVESFFVRRPGKLVGAKIMTFHLDELPLKLPEMLDVLARPKVIVLYRGNMLEQFVSFKLAQRDDIWHIKKPKDIRPIWVDPDEFLAFAERERRMWQDTVAALDGADPYYVPYDQLANWPEIAMRGVFDYLEVAAARARTRFVRTNPKPLWRKITNYKHFVDCGIPQRAQLRLPFPASQALLREVA